MFDQQGTPEVNHSRNITFQGTGSGYFGVCIVNFLLTLVTFGIFAPWAYVRCKRYIYSNTELSGSRFSYNVKGGSLFISWLCLFVFFGALEFSIIKQSSPLSFCLLAILILFMPYLVIQSLRYQLQSTTLNNVRFNFNASGFKAWWVMMGAPLLMLAGVLLICSMIVYTASSASLFEMERIVITIVIAMIVGILGFGAVQGVAVGMWLNLLFNGLSFGTQKFAATVSVKKCVMFSIIGMLLLTPFLLLVLKLIAPTIVHVVLSGGMMSPDELASVQGTILICYLIYLFGLIVSFSYLYVMMRNYYYKHVLLSEKIAFRSTLTLAGFVGQLVINGLITFCTFGIAYPWARIRYCRYLAKNTWVDGDLDDLELQDHDDKIATDVVSRISRGLVPNLNL
ncbi:YjgN family protein [Buttiauxella massiliensis]|uniref:YjgN family protein n=1 Tax=Buttiauxella massiliensis TaxID=2831590 RepID=UPI00125F4515|nr:DUF898 family protein [Buttiauxella massiliensis]